MKQIKKNIQKSGWVYFVLLALFFNSCALKKQPEHQAIVADVFVDSTFIPSQWILKTNSDSVNKNWLKNFNDPILEKIVAEAIRNNFDLKRAATNIEITQQNINVVASQMKPKVGINIGGNATIDDGDSSVFTSGNGFSIASWEPDVWGKVRSEKAGATAVFEATSLNYEYARQSLAAITAKSWFLAVEASQLVTLFEEVVATYTEILEVVNIRRKLGKVGDLDVVEAKANLNAAQNDLIKYKGLYAETQRNLETLLGRYPSAEIQTAKNFATLPSEVQAGIPSMLLSRRPDLIAAEKIVIAAFRQQESAKLALLPSFSFNLGAGLLSDALLNILKLNPWMLGAGIGMSVPIYSGGKIPAQIKIATAQQQQAVANYGSVSLKAFKEVENNLMNENLLAQRLPYQQEIINNRNEAVKIAKVKYELGKMDLLPVLQLQNALIASQEELIKLQNAQLSNRINLYLTLGGNF